MMLLHLGIGSDSPNRMGSYLAEMLRGPIEEGGANWVVWQIRLPRSLIALLIGAGLGLIGAAYQAYFQNPLAEPFLLGNSSGSAIGAVLVMVLGFGGIALGVPVVGGALIGGGVALWIVLRLGRGPSGFESQRMILAGVLLATLLSSLLTLVLLFSGQDSNRVLRWLLGSLSPAFWPSVALVAIALLIALIAILPLARSLNLLSVSYDWAQTAGVDRQRTSVRLLVSSALLTATVVGTAGIIGFVGLVSPHVARRLVGANLVRLLPASAAIGACILLFADLLAQQIAPGQELPVGAVTAVVGPLLLAGVHRIGRPVQAANPM